MVRAPLSIVFAATAVVCMNAEARSPVEPDDGYGGDTGDTIAEADDPPAFNMLGFNLALGALPRDGAKTVVGSLGLGVEHPVFTRTRVAFEYDWLWLSEQDVSMRMADAGAIRPEHHGSGHRVGLSLRRELKAKSGRTLRLFLDAEAGATVALVNDNMDGSAVIPGGYVGMRAGYDLYSRREDSPSRTFETALLVRAHGVRDGVGFTLGIGMFWGN